MQEQGITVRLRRRSLILDAGVGGPAVRPLACARASHATCARARRKKLDNKGYDSAQGKKKQSVAPQGAVAALGAAYVQETLALADQIEEWIAIVCVCARMRTRSTSATCCRLCALLRPAAA